AAAGGGEAAVGAAQTQHTSNVPGDQVPKKFLYRGFRTAPKEDIENMKVEKMSVEDKEKYLKDLKWTEKEKAYSKEDWKKYCHKAPCGDKPFSDAVPKDAKFPPKKGTSNATTNLNEAGDQHTETAPREQEHVADRVA
ncbi:hypothetical protein DQ04_26501000, partial [Trypanosoma grayi]|uniref:hypothetical protein n=1 Tax=Trypanosoma grayi TaxID=71804 RepID=UPI0004F47C65